MAPEPSDGSLMLDECSPLREENGFGAKSIGFLGGIMLLCNNLAGPTIAIMPEFAQDVGWLSLLLIMLFLALACAVCGHMLLEAMRAIPKNEDFGVRVEFVYLLNHYMSPFWGSFCMVCYFGYLLLTLMSYIIQTAQVLDYVILDVAGCAPGVQFTSLFVCGDDRQTETPFGYEFTLPSSFALLAIVCLPLARLNLDENIIFQWIATVGVFILALVWVGWLSSQPAFPATSVPAFSYGAPWGLAGCILFNFALMGTLPSWVNEKESDVPPNLSFSLSLLFVVIVYTFVAIIGGMAFEDDNIGNLFSHLTSSNSALMKTTVWLYPCLQNLTSIPVFTIILKYNLIQMGWFKPSSATLVSFTVPMFLSIPFYTGKGFKWISEVGGIAFSSVVNFAVPIALYLIMRRRQKEARDVDLQSP